MAELVVIPSPLQLTIKFTMGLGLLLMRVKSLLSTSSSQSAISIIDVGTVSGVLDGSLPNSFIQHPCL